MRVSLNFSELLHCRKTISTGVQCADVRSSLMAANMAITGAQSHFTIAENVSIMLVLK